MLFVFFVCFYVMLAFLVLMFNIHRKTGAPLYSALGSVTSVTSELPQARWQSHPEKDVLGHRARPAGTSCAGSCHVALRLAATLTWLASGTHTLAVGQPNDSNCSFQHLEIALIREKASVLAMQTPKVEKHLVKHFEKRNHCHKGC